MTSHRITFLLPDGTTHQVDADPSVYVLEAGLAAGLDLPYSCLQGWCLTCAAGLVNGRMDQRDSRRYYPADLEHGFVLPCTGRACSDLTVKTHQRDAMRAARLAVGLPFPRGDWGGR